MSGSFSRSTLFLTIFLTANYQMIWQYFWQADYQMLIEPQARRYNDKIGWATPKPHLEVATCIPIFNKAGHKFFTTKFFYATADRVSIEFRSKFRTLCITSVFRLCSFVPRKCITILKKKIIKKSWLTDPIIFSYVTGNKHIFLLALLHVAIKFANSTFSFVRWLDIAFKSQVAYLPRGSVISERPHVFECVHLICALKHNTDMISLYRTSTACQEMKNANWVTVIVNLYSVTMNNQHIECK